MNDGLLGFPRGAALPNGLLGFAPGLLDLGSPRFATYFQAAGQTFFDAVNAPAGANTKPTTWTVLAAATEFDADGLIVRFDSSGTQSPCLFDFAYGPTDNALTLLAENLGVCGNGGAGAGTNAHPAGITFIPGKIPAGSRLVARVQCGTGSQGFRIAPTIAGGGFYRLISQLLGEGSVTHVGTVLASSKGTTIDPGGSANAKGAWTELGRVEKRIRAMIVCVQQENAAPSTAYFRLDLAKNTGREIIIPDLAITTAIGTSNSGEGMQGDGLTQLLFADVEAGETLAARLQCSITDATDRLLSVNVVGFS